MLRAAGCFIAIVLIATSVAAQPRDNSAKPGTAVLRGRVVASDTGGPLRQARVRLIPEGPGTGNSRPESRGASTAADGTYEFKGLAAGRYTVMVSKTRYVTLSYGQRRPGEPGKPIEVLAGQRIEKVDFSLMRGAILTGRIVDEFGEPVDAVSISLVPSREAQRNRLVDNGHSASTNDLGEFRIVGVPPGQYVLSAMAYMQDEIVGDDRAAYTATYYPGTANLAEARRLTISVGQTLNDLSMTLVRIPTARVSGVVMDSQGRPMSIGLVTAAPRNSFGLAAPAASAMKADGSFQLSGLAPGDYILVAFTMGGPAEESATATITIAGQDVTGVQLLAAKPSTLTGHIVTSDPDGAQPLQSSQVFIHASPKERTLATMGGFAPPARVGEDGTFSIKARPGFISIGAGSVMANWKLRAVRLNGVDVTDAGFEVKANEDVGGLEVELTNRISMVSGLVTNARGEPVSDYSAIVFSQDRDRWGEDSRYIDGGRPDQDGRYKVSGLPAGEYFAIAVDSFDSFDPADAKSPEFLERASRHAIRFTLGDGETRSVDLKLTTDF